MFHLRPGEESLAFNVLSRFQMEALTAEIVDLGATLFRRWHPSHGIGTNDALLAAAALLTDREVITQNLKHFPMPEVRVRQGWLES
jgi:predicted nucleic acid-binding protein